MLERIQKEPVLVTGLARALILCVTAFGLSLSPEQIGAIMLLVEAVLSLVARSSVTPLDLDVDPAPLQD